MKLKLKPVLLVLGAFLLALVLVSVFKVVPAQSPQPSPSPDELNFVGWRQYRHPKFPYQLKYHHACYILKEDSGSQLPATTLIANVPEDKLGSPHVTFEVTVNSFSAELKNYPEVVDLQNQGYVARSLKIDQEPALLIDNLGEGGDQINVYVAHQEYVYRLSWTGTHPDVRSYFDKNLLQMVVSFQFTDQEK